MAATGAGVEEEVKLLGMWSSQFVARARVALNVKGVGYELLEETFAGKSELLLQSNPVYGKMPVLIHGGRPICESMIIVQYVDEAWASRRPSILPRAPRDRALARFWAVFIDDKWIRSLFGILIARTDDAKAEATRQVVAGLQLLEEVYEREFKGRAFFGGDNIGYLDIALGCNLGWIGVISRVCDVELLDEDRTPQLVGWAERFRSDDAVRGVIPDTDQFVEVAEVVRVKLRMMM
ncbi:glutathione S-transferase U17-like isoform X2 [Iris pallida]|uniref:Glutathione S-transferase n=1 Tax=Iris pallida TaxID=29817 RepID=A0AAX6E5Q9_IRIPA|nr:glutathione S-transferase U17-like isoform X2 [Iris pallida]